MRKPRRNGRSPRQPAARRQRLILTGSRSGWLCIDPRNNSRSSSSRTCSTRGRRRVEPRILAPEVRSRSSPATYARVEQPPLAAAWVTLRQSRFQISLSAGRPPVRRSSRSGWRRLGPTMGARLLSATGDETRHTHDVVTRARTAARRRPRAARRACFRGLKLSPRVAVSDLPEATYTLH